VASTDPNLTLKPVDWLPGRLSARVPIDRGGPGSPTLYGTFSVTGSATLAGTLFTTLWFSPAAGDRFDILHDDGGIKGTFDTVFLGPLADDLAWEIDYTVNDLWLTVAAANPPVPEPGAGWLFALGLAGLVLLRRLA